MNSCLRAIASVALVVACSAPDTGSEPTPKSSEPADFSLDRASLPTPDISNAYADDAKAAALGQKLFLEVAFSGPLLDLDDDGGPNLAV